MRETSWRDERTGKFKWVKRIAVVVVLAALVFFAFEYFTRPKDNGGSEAQTAAVVADVRKVMILPSGSPTVTTVNKVTDLKKQAFFAQVQKGDKVLIYVEARKIIIYRPSTHQIVNAGPILNDTNSTASTDTKK